MRKAHLSGFCSVVALLIAIPFNSFAQPASKPNPVKTIPFKVCSESLNWTRPTYEEQKRHLLEIPRRYGSSLKEIETLLRGNEQWNKNIFASTVYGSSGAYDTAQLSGLWKPAKFFYPNPCNDAISINNGKIAEVYALNYKVISVLWNGSQYLISVKTVSEGAQRIHFPRREQRDKLPLSVVDENGQDVSVAFE